MVQEGGEGTGAAAGGGGEDPVSPFTPDCSGVAKTPHPFPIQTDRSQFSYPTLLGVTPVWASKF